MQVSAENNLFIDMLRVMEELFSIRDWKEEEFDDINFLVLFDGLSAKKFSYEFSRPSLYRVRPNTSFYIEYPEYIFRNDDMTNPDALKGVYQFVKKNFPAKKYGFIYKGHGSHGEGDIGSRVFKERIMKVPVSLTRNENYDKLEALINKKARFFKGWQVADFYPISGYRSLNVKEAYLMVILARRSEKTLTYRMMADVLTGVFGKNKFDFLFLDCCWGMQIESAYSFRDVSKYFVASADLMPAAGVGYSDFIRKLMDRPQITGREVANILLSVFFTNKYDDYDNEDDPSFRKMGVSLTNMKMDELPLFITALNNLCNYLASDIYRYAALVKKVRDQCDDYTYSGRALDFCMFNIDLIWFLENLIYFNRRYLKDENLESLAFEVLYIATVRLRYGFMGNNYKKYKPGTRTIGGNGITITFPENWQQYHKSMFPDKKEVRPEFATDTLWRDFLKSYYRHVKSIYTGKKTINEYQEKLKADTGLKRLMGIQHKSAASIVAGVRRFFKTVIEK